MVPNEAVLYVETEEPLEHGPEGSWRVLEKWTGSLTGLTDSAVHTLAGSRVYVCRTADIVCLGVFSETD